MIGETGDIGETYNIGEIGKTGEIYIGETGEIINLIFNENENSNESSCVFYERNIRKTSISFFDDKNTLIIQDLENTKENNTTKEKKKNIREVKKNDEIWNYFIKGLDLGKGFYEVQCKWYNEKWPRERPKNIKIHLARNCEYVPNNIKALWRENFLEEVSRFNIKSKSIKQPTITSHFNNTNSLPTSKTNEINQAILKVWVCCGFPFHTIENPFIIDLFRIAIPGYKLPSCDTLSNKLLDQETIKIEKKIETELEKEKYLTISKY
ncbi:hypothetical protein Glove_132g80 [Diversispora epigaea]|uniref:Uncharacterized protein n=1 Tax=Diversispora epigaea TaxID=1348612 RepID=A0A397J244_9GLOM|nr:hypothetical protein Glove_132g80 [Diversispora epigaea]